MGVMFEIGIWCKGHHIARSSKVALPDKEVRVWELDNGEVGVIEKHRGFLEFHVENKPYGVVTGNLKRKARRLMEGSNHDLLH